MSSNNFELPEEIIIPEEEMQVDADGKKFLYERDGVKYGGDYLPEPTPEISLEEDADFPPAPEEFNPVL